MRLTPAGRLQLIYAWHLRIDYELAKLGDKPMWFRPWARKRWRTRQAELMLADSRLRALFARDEFPVDDLETAMSTV